MRMKLLKKEHCTSKSAETCIEHGALSAPLPRCKSTLDILNG